MRIKGSPTQPVRRSTRTSTQKQTQASEQLAKQRATAPSKGHATAESRAVAPDPSKPTSTTNDANVEALRQNKAYKSGTVRVHYKGERDANGATAGNPLSGAKIDRGSWYKDQVEVSQNLGKKLLGQPGFVGAPNAHGVHGAEIAHVRRQAEGGMTDRLGAQPASWHFNVEDMAREEGMEKLSKKLGDDVRMKSTVYVHATGENAGTVKARREKIFVRVNNRWEKKLDHLQDGHRGNIDKTEVRSLKRRFEDLDASSANADLHPELRPPQAKRRKVFIPAKSSVAKQKAFIPQRNDTTTSPYFTDLQVTDPKTGQERRLTGQKADDYMKQILDEGRKHIRP